MIKVVSRLFAAWMVAVVALSVLGVGAGDAHTSGPVTALAAAPVFMPDQAQPRADGTPGEVCQVAPCHIAIESAGGQEPPLPHTGGVHFPQRIVVLSGRVPGMPAQPPKFPQA